MNETQIVNVEVHYDFWNKQDIIVTNHHSWCSDVIKHDEKCRYLNVITVTKLKKKRKIVMTRTYSK